MDPNAWNYGLQYGHSSAGGLPTSHPSLNRLDLSSSLGLSHGLQATHGSLSGRPVSSLPGMNYSTLGVNILEPMAPLATGISQQSPHKTMSLAQGQLVFDPQVRVSAEQTSPGAGRYDPSSKARDAMTRNQILEAAAAARMWGTSNFTPASIYNQFFGEVVNPAITTMASSPSPGSGSTLSVPKSTHAQLQDPPPAHSSGAARLTAVQRAPHSTDLYGRGGESLAQISSLYNSTVLSKQTLSSSQQQTTALHRQTPINVQQSYSTSHEGIEDLSSSSQNLYSPYSGLGPSSSQDFSTAQLTGDIREMNYEAVSPAPPMNEGGQSHSDNTSFSIAQFPELVNLTSEDAHSLADKFQENDFRLKMDSDRVQQPQHDVLTFSQLGSRQDLGTSHKIPKDNLQAAMLSMQTSQRLGPFAQPLSQPLSSSQLPATSSSLSQQAALLQGQQTILTNSSMQQPQVPPVQALADSTTKPKRQRNRKKKGDVGNPPVAGSGSPKKSGTAQMSSDSSLQQHLTQHSPHILNMPPTSHQITSMPPSSPHLNQNSQLQQGFGNSAINQFNSRDVQKTNIPQNFSLQEHQAPNSNTLRSPGEFALPGRVINDNNSNYKQQRKTNKSSLKINTSQNNHLYRSSIPDSHHMQNFSNRSALLGSNDQRGSPMQDSRPGNISTLPGFPEQSQQSMANQPSPQNVAASSDNSFAGNKMTSTSHYLPTNVLGNQTAVSDTRPMSVEPIAMSQQYSSGRQEELAQDTGTSQFQMDLMDNQPFLEQLVGVQASMPVSSATTYSHTAQGDTGQVVFTTLVTPAESARMQQQQQQPPPQAQQEDPNTFRPTYHGETVHEIRPIGPLGGSLTINDGPFNGFFDTSMDQKPVSSHMMEQQVPAPVPEPMTLTYVPHIVEDDELAHFNQPGNSDPVVMVKKERGDHWHNQKNSFQDSFLSYLQGNKQETLSSVSSSAVTKKPMLPKYIPEPRRPRPPPPPPKEVTVLSDGDDAGTSIAPSRIKDLISNLSDNDNSSQKSESDKEGYSIQRTSDLAVKITLPKSKKNRFGPFAESSLLKDSMRKSKEVRTKSKKKKGKQRDSEGEEFVPGNVSGEDAVYGRREKVQREPTPPPARTSIGRKAKEKCIEKTRKRRKATDSGSSSDDNFVPFINKGKGFNSDDSDKNYDSDKDPVWMPFEVDLKHGPDFDEKKKKPRRQRLRVSSVKQTKQVPQKTMAPSTSFSSATPTTIAGSSAVAEDADSPFQLGKYLLEKKDLQNYDSYPIWRLENGNIIHKFEMVIHDGNVCHQAVGTYSTWMKSLQNQFEPIRIKEIARSKGEATVVEVVDECKPKAPTEKLEIQYEDDPLVEPFNIYLQVFLSQALEPNFLSAVLDHQEAFYVDALKQIDKLIEEKCQEIDKLAQWKVSFKDYLQKCPLMKEIDRPNLKQSCQACENASPPTIKSVIFSGHAYDRFLLTQLPSSGSDVSQEFMIGKTAAYYVRPYHSLYHYKYWLRQRCDAKVKMMKESNKCENLAILDKCLENRSWVLQLFDNLKSLLLYGGEAPR